MKYKHIAVYPDTKTRFDNAQEQEQLKNPRPVTADDFQKRLLDLWEQAEQGVLEVKPK